MKRTLAIILAGFMVLDCIVCVIHLIRGEVSRLEVAVPVGYALSASLDDLAERLVSRHQAR